MGGEVVVVEGDVEAVVAGAIAVEAEEFFVEELL